MAAAAKIIKKSGKENAPPVSSRSKKVVEEDELDDFDEVAPKSKVASGKKSRSGEEDDVDVHKKLETVTAERDRLRTQRDTFSKQFEELSNLRTSEAEKVFEQFKEKSEARSTAQNDLITNLTALNEKLQARIQSLEKAAKADLPAAGGVFNEIAPAAQAAAPPPKADPKEVKALKERLAKVEGSLKKKADDLEQLDKMYKAEVEASQKLLASRSNGLAASTSAVEPVDTKEDSLKDSACLRLYEDILELAILNVKIKEGKCGPKDKEYTFTCIQTVGKRTISFKLRTFLEIDQQLVQSKARNPYVPTIEFTPNFQGDEDAAFLDKLGIFKEAFSAPRVQLWDLFEALRGNLGEGVVE